MKYDQDTDRDPVIRDYSKKKNPSHTQFSPQFVPEPDLPSGLR